MKKVYSIFIIIGGILLSASACVPLDTAPYDRDSDLSFWQNDPDAAISALNTCYVSLTDMYGLVYSDGMTDNAYVKGGQTKSIGNGTYGTSEGYVESLWAGHYSGIRDCNELLANINKVPSLDEGLKARYIAEARTLRAWHYYDLYTRFGGVPYITGLISIAESRTITRTPVEQVVSKIIAELEEVIESEVLPGSYSGEDRGRITQWTAMAILAKVYLFEGNFGKVRDITAQIMRDSGISLFPSYSGLFEIDNEFCSEIMLSSQYLPVFKEHNIMYNLIPPSMGGYTNIAPLKSLVDSYIMLNGKAIGEDGSGYDEENPWEGRDPRMAATIMYPGNSYPLRNGGTAVPLWDGSDAYNYSSDVTPTGYYIRKWWDNTYRLTLLSGLNPILIRYADILLMNAEAHVELGTMDSNVWNATIRPIRQRAGFTQAAALDFPSAGADLKETVRNERRCELAFEGSRRNDIIRWRIAEEVLNGWCHGLYTGEAVGTDGGFVRIELRQFDANKHYLWPIPQKERDLNKNLEQNPNW
ncbi:MAG: RagB/SusD family nutrient uptake outer membrane protein [Bacteroidales bacterium]|nr:RagB/SusD family nutrient uptake outer membrane protein [Bacteroidales bacterium]